MFSRKGNKKNNKENKNKKMCFSLITHLLCTDFVPNTAPVLSHYLNIRSKDTYCTTEDHNLSFSQHSCF